MLVKELGPDERRVITFDFSPDLLVGETLVGAIVSSVSMALGGDPQPSSVLNGVAAFDVTDKKVLVPVKGGLVDRNYAIKIVVGTTDPLKVLALIAHLPIRDEPK